MFASIEIAVKNPNPLEQYSRTPIVPETRNNNNSVFQSNLIVLAINLLVVNYNSKNSYRLD